MNAIQNLPPVADMMRSAGLEPKKRLGQNFLFDLNLTGRIARSVPDIENSTVLEIGPGPGGLTRALLSTGAKRVIAMEKDRSAEPILRKIQDASDGRLEVIFGDALKAFKVSSERGALDKIAAQFFRDDITNGKISICSNLPYNVGTELLVRWLHIMATTDRISSMTLMFQREVAERIVARQGDPGYGRLSVLVSLIADAKILFDVPNTAFVPKPKVQSAVVRILPKARLEISKIERISAILFGQRRKMIRGIMPNVNWSLFGLSGCERAQELPPEKFAEIAAQL